MSVPDEGSFNEVRELLLKDIKEAGSLEFRAAAVSTHDTWVTSYCNQLQISKLLNCVCKVENQV